MRAFLLLLASMPMLVSCAKQKQSASLPGVFVESLIKQKFELLEPYFPTIEFHKSLERNGTDGSDSAAVKFVEESNIKLKENWTKISEKIKTGNIDLSKLKIIESVSAQPFWTKKISRIVVVYSYDNKNWDDMEFIVGEFNNKNLLLEIPHPEKVFSMADSSLKASKDVQFEKDIRTPEFKKVLQDKVEKIISYAKENNVKEFKEYIASPDDSVATVGGGRDEIAAGLMKKINNIVEACNKPDYGDVNSLNLENSIWIVIQLKCSNKFVHFAFTRINEKLLLNDVDEAGLK